MARRFGAGDSNCVCASGGDSAIGAGAKLAAEGPDRFQPFASLLANAFTQAYAEPWRIFGYWGALGSVLAFLMYFPYSKHIHIFMAPAGVPLAFFVTVLWILVVSSVWPAFKGIFQR